MVMLLPLTRRRLFAGLLASAVSLAACRSSASSRDDAAELLAWPAQDRWPALFYQSAQETQEAYRYAVQHPEILQYFPCYCGCVDWGHRSNLDCYVKEFRSDGSVVLDRMSFG